MKGIKDYDLSRSATKQYLSPTSICILRCFQKFCKRVRKRARESSKTSGTVETPFFESATQRYCLMALRNISFVWKKNRGRIDRIDTEPDNNSRAKLTSPIIHLENGSGILQDGEQKLKRENLRTKLVRLGIGRCDLVQRFHRQLA